ncbi:hypothetical protein DDD_0326 [Nonlabens dokdonensis DSW-6]|uniref:Uncharacterized protein n=1 Tax=Nonlabens dokdonensis (strain DSM 17205 / KCTC 12402 / DSW-6) TaxID=592029 RepID=L7W5S8_NONDD|nr:hypothetical protein DDD_0326 [Nonlabens dokdonensis DSW-6]
MFETNNESVSFWLLQPNIAKVKMIKNVFFMGEFKVMKI